MKIRGGDLDLMEFEFTSFRPGENIHTIGLEREYHLSPSPSPVRVIAPARAHLSVLDMNRFAPGTPGGGGFGFALQVYCTVTTSCTPSGLEIEYTRAPLIEHFTRVFMKTVGYTGGFSIQAQDHSYLHVGLGSTSTIIMALAVALNHAVGDPLSREELRYLVGHNYVEETDDAHVAFGFETGVGPAACCYGGFAVLGDRLTIVFQHEFAKDKNVYVVIPPSESSSSGDQEFELLMNKARTLDYQDREQKAYYIMMDMLPALVRGDIRRMGDIMWEIEFRGSKRAEIEHHSFEMYQYMHNLRQAGLEFVGMSSVGPSIVIVTEKEKDAVTSIIEPLGLTLKIKTAVDNQGIRIIA
ncbi:MAG: GHMP kinase [Methanomicrobiales archaeon]|jgi:beta-RFAP synthase|nr:GHMP kinase [Methanomicrobiales archaeon]